MAFKWDNNKNKSNKEKHGYSFEEVKGLFSDPNKVTHESYSGSDSERFNTVGKTLGDLFSAIWTPRGEDIRLISGRKANNKERGWYNE